MEQPTPPSPLPRLKRLLIIGLAMLALWFVAQKLFPVAPLAPSTPAPVATVPVETPPAPVQEEAPPVPAAPAEEAPPPVASPALDHLENRVQQQAEALEALAAKHEKALSRIEALSAYGALKDAALSGKPFTQELARFQQHAQAPETLKPLEQVAAYGVPSLSFLQQSFPAALRQALNQPADESAGVWEKTKQRFTSLIIIRRTGAQEGNALEARLARAEIALKQDDIGTALEALRDVPETPALSDWVTHARARVEALDALDGAQP